MEPRFSVLLEVGLRMASRRTFNIMRARSAKFNSIKGGNMRQQDPAARNLQVKT
jgi:hypothetical protein